MTFTVRRAFLEKARALQERLAGLVLEEANEPGDYLAGADAAYGNGRACGAIAVWDRAERRVVETATATVPASIAYIPGLLAWRELPALLAAWQELTHPVDVVLCDGHGRAHPRRCGLACLVGLILDVPAIGCAKNRLIGRSVALARERGSRAPLVDRAEVVGTAVRTRSGVRPVYVSVGHRITLQRAEELVLEASRYRIPEPLRAAHTAVAAERLRGSLAPCPTQLRAAGCSPRAGAGPSGQ